MAFSMASTAGSVQSVGSTAWTETTPTNSPSCSSGVEHLARHPVVVLERRDLGRVDTYISLHDHLPLVLQNQDCRGLVDVDRLIPDQGHTARDRAHTGRTSLRQDWVVTVVGSVDPDRDAAGVRLVEQVPQQSPAAP